MHSKILARLFEPERLWTVDEVLDGALDVGDRRGLYVWHFSKVPGAMPRGTCCRHHGYFALYVGIAPSGPASASTLHRRLRVHCAGDASRSTLRKSLGALLHLRLRRAANGRFTFGVEEEVLTSWMRRYARVSWALAPSPWKVERAVLANYDLPLNIAHNRGHSFAAQLRALRRAAREA